MFIFLKGMYDEKGRFIKPKSPIHSSKESSSINTLSDVPLPPPEPTMHQSSTVIPTGVPPTPLQNFQHGLLPPGLALPPSLESKDPNLEFLMAVANSNNAQTGILGARPQIQHALVSFFYINKDKYSKF